jgi:hypothetical protein
MAGNRSKGHPTALAGGFSFSVIIQPHLGIATERLVMRVSAVIACLPLAAACFGQQLAQRLTNQDVLDMVALGLSDDVIIDKIHATGASDFDTSVAALRTLKLGRVSDAVIRAMINTHPNPAPASALAPISPVASDTGLPENAGVYVVLRGKPTEMEPEVVNWQTGGVAKSWATLSLVKGDLNGKVVKPNSPTRLTAPLEFLIKPIEGTSVTEYQLLRLHQKGNRREFRSVTGGVLHQSGGAQRDEMPFESAKIGNQLWRVRVDSLQTGEYGFLAPGTSSVSISASGKMYTFGVIEGDPAGAPSHVAQDGGRADASGSSPGSAPAPPVFSDATIGVSTEGNPNLRRDGITLAGVTLGGPAGQAGLRTGDVILAIDDRYLFTAEELNNEIHHHKPGTRVAVRYRRYSTIYDTYLTVGTAQ